jgi:hypothetical protein
MDISYVLRQIVNAMRDDNALRKAVEIVVVGEDDFLRGYALFKFSNYIKLIFQFVWGFWGYRRGEVSFQVFDIFYVLGFSEGRKWRASQRTFCAGASFSAGFEEAGMFS